MSIERVEKIEKFKTVKVVNVKKKWKIAYDFSKIILHIQIMSCVKENWWF